MGTKRNDKMDIVLKGVLYTKQNPDAKMHQKVLAQWEEESRKRENLVHKMRWQPVMAVLCAMLLVLGGSGAYAATHNISLGELFQNVWSGEQQSKIEPYSEEFHIIKQQNTTKNLSIEPVKLISDGYMAYLVLKVTGKKEYQLSDDMIIANEMGSANTSESEFSSIGYYYLKKEGNSIYYAIYMGGRRERSEKTKIRISVENIRFRHGTFDKRTGCIDDIEWINDEAKLDYISDGQYSATIEANVKDDKVSMKIDGVQYDIYAMGVQVDDDVTEILEDPEGKTWWDTRAAVVLKDGTEIAISPRSADAYGTDCILQEPIDLEEIRGIRIGKKVYELNK